MCSPRRRYSPSSTQAGIGTLTELAPVHTRVDQLSVPGETSRLCTKRVKGECFSTKGTLERTLRRPRQPIIRHLRVVLVNLEPVRARAVVGRGGLALGHLGEPRGEGPLVADGAGDVEGDVAAGLDVGRDDALCVARGELEAGDLRGCYVGRGTVALVVFCRADVLPGGLFEGGIPISFRRLGYGVMSGR